MGDADRGAALAGRARQAVVSLIAVELQDPVKAGEEALGIFTAASGGVKIDHPRWIVTASCCLAYRFAVSVRLSRSDGAMECLLDVHQR